MWTHDAEDEDDARGLRKEDGDVTTPRMSLRQRRRRSRHRASLFLGTCVALAVAFAMLRSGVREHRGARDRVDGGVDGDYEAHAGEPFEERAPPESLGGVRPGADPDSTTTGASFSETHEAIRASMRRGAVVKQHRNSDTDEAGSGSGATIDPFAIRSTPKPETALGALFRFFGAERVSLGAANAEDASALKIKSRRRKARLHVTRDPSTGHLTMNDVGAGAFAVSQPRACAPIASEADGEADSVAGAMVTLRAAFRVGKILRRCDAVSVVAFRFGSSENYRYRGGEEYRDDHSRDIRDETQKQKKLALGDAETLLRDLNEGTLYGPVCYTPDFLRGVASTLSVCSRNHEDGVALALLGFAGVGGDKTRAGDSEKKESLRPRLLVSVSDAVANAPERGASAYLVYNHKFRGAFVDARGDAAAARRAHFRNRGVPTSGGDGDGGGELHERGRSGAAACVHGRVAPTTVGAEIRGALAALEGHARVEADASVEKNADASDASDDETDTGFGKKTRGAPRRVEIDLLTLDVECDGLYLVQPALLTVSPRVIAASYDSAFGPERALAANPSASREPVREPSSDKSSGTESDARIFDTDVGAEKRASRAYRRDGSTFGKSNAGAFSERDRLSGLSADGDDESALAPRKRSASLSAYVKALERWGFHFVGCEAAGETAFFLRADVIEAAHRAGRGSVHVTTPEDSGCFSARGPRMAMREWATREAERVSEGGENAEFTEVNEAWLAVHAPGMPWREDDAFLADAEELRR